VRLRLHLRVRVKVRGRGRVGSTCSGPLANCSAPFAGAREAEPRLAGGRRVLEDVHRVRRAWRRAAAGDPAVAHRQRAVRSTRLGLGLG
jgi:hypothetical protein